MANPALNTPIIIFVSESTDKVNKSRLQKITHISTQVSSDVFKINSETILPVDKFESLKNQISLLSKLKKNWDGYGAIPVFENISDKGVQLLTILGSTFIERVSDVFPNPHGTLTIEWENRKKEKIALEIGEDNYSYFVMYEQKEPLLVDGENILADLKMLTSNLESLFSEEIPKYILQG